MDRGSQLDEEEEDEEEKEKEKEKEREEEEKRKAADIKSNNPHLAGGEKNVPNHQPDKNASANVLEISPHDHEQEESPLVMIVSSLGCRIQP